MALEKLGRWLRETRKAKGCTLEDAEAATRIPAKSLRLLEEGDFAAFPGGDVQLRGFLRIYGRYLDLSPREVIRRYCAEVYDSETLPVTALPEEAQSEPPEPTEDLTSIRFRPRDIPVSTTLPRWMSLETVLIVGIVLTVLLAILAIVSYVLGQAENEQRPLSVGTTAPTEIGVAVPTTPSPLDTSPSRVTDIGEKVTVELEATEDALLGVEQGAEVVFGDARAPGQTGTWSDEEVIAVEAGRGAGSEGAVNGQNQEAMRRRGEVCSLVWGPFGPQANGRVAPP